MRHGEEGRGTDDGGVGGAEFREDGFGLGEGRGVDGVFDFEGYFVGRAAGQHVSMDGAIIIDGVVILAVLGEVHVS